jgi:hypothetical protein
MDNADTLITLGTHDTGLKTSKTQRKKLKTWATRIQLNTGDEPRCPRRVSSSCFLNIEFRSTVFDYPFVIYSSNGRNINGNHMGNKGITDIIFVVCII